MLIPRLFRTVAGGGTISLAGEDGIRINPVQVEDAAVACANILNLDCGSYVFNIGGSEVVSIREIGNMMGNILGKEPLFSVAEAKADDLVGDISLMRQLLHTPAIDLKTGLALMPGGGE
jgi:nucleoside-diphosphate-sugar epimerase